MKTDMDEEKMLQILRKIQEFDPPGVGARDLRESLLIQVNQPDFEKNPVAEAIIKDHLSRLERNAYKEIAKELGVSVDEVQSASMLIRTLEPKPGRAYGVTSTHYIQPDVYIYKVGDDFKIVLNEDGLPKLRINKLYQRYKQADTDSATKQYVEQKFRNALWLIKSVEQRQRTIYKVAESIL